VKKLEGRGTEMWHQHQWFALCSICLHQ